MSMLLTVGAYALWFVIQSLAYMYVAFISGMGLCYGFHVTKTVINKKYLKKAEEELLTAGTATDAV